MPPPPSAPQTQDTPQVTLGMVYRLDEWSREDWTTLSCKVVGPEAPLPPVARSSELRLSLEWLEATFVEGGYYSLLVGGGDGDQQFFQVLRKTSVSRKRVRTLRSERERPLHLKLLIQPLGVLGSASGPVATAFAEGDPFTQEALEFARMRTFTDRMWEWAARASDVSRCVALFDRRRAGPPATLEDSAKPTLCLIRALMLTGWRPVQRAIKHTPALIGAQDFDVTNAASKKQYYLCLPLLSRLFAAGVRELPSNAIQKFYQALLAGHVVPAGLSDAAYRQVLDSSGEGALALEANQLPHLLALPGPAADDAAEGPLDIDSDEVLPLGSLALQPSESHARRNAPLSPSTSNSSSSPIESDEIMDAEPPALIVVPPVIEGGKIRVEDKTNKWGYRRYIMTCSLHPGCRKHRNAHARQMANCGAWEPVGYLAVWHAKRHEFGDAASHCKACAPTLLEVKDWLLAHGHLEARS